MEAGSGSRRTRSQVGPDWSSKEALILVNEVATVEADCLKALSSYQKWKIISENCTALDVPRTANQCRRKWDSLLDQYKMIVRSRTYRNSESGSFPPNFDLDLDLDLDLFKAIDDFLMAKDNQSDTDPDADPETKAEADLSEAIAQLGSKRRRRQSMRVKQCAEQKLFKGQLQEKDQKSGGTEEKLCDSHVEEKPHKGHSEKKPRNSCMKEKTPLTSSMEEKIAINIEENEQMIVVKLQENVEWIHAIVAETESADFSDADLNKVQDLQSEFVRRQGDKLIACLRQIVNMLNQFTDNV